MNRLMAGRTPASNTRPYQRVQEDEAAHESRLEEALTEEERMLADSFDPEDREEEDEEEDEITVRQQQADVALQSTDGVFSNIQAKEDPSEKLEEHPPSYEAAAADAAPPYWETQIAPGMATDEVYIDGLPVGNVFSFVWNLLISMAFQFVGFLLTYLLHTTHAAKQGSRAGLGITLIQYGFYIRFPSNNMRIGDPSAGAPPSDDGSSAPPADPSSGDPIELTAGGEWLSYVLMVAGWFLLIKSMVDFLRARRMEKLVLATPAVGLTEEEAAQPAVAV